MIDLQRLPKAELHLHIEGTFEPELIFALSERNGVPLPYPDVQSLRDAYQFSDLQSFLDLYYAAMGVLRTERDFYELTSAYAQRAVAQGVRHAEIFFDPQAHLQRGIAFETVVDGITAALDDARRRTGLTSHLIMCFLRDLPAQAAFETLERAKTRRDRILAVGLDSAEVGNPPAKFATVFEQARAQGYLTVAHAGEEGPPDYIWQALDMLKVSRIDHGVRCLEDERLVQRLRRQRTPLTVCPFSNVRLRVVDTLAHHPLRRMLDAGLVATVNSDDPAYFGGYIGDNFQGVANDLHLSDDDIVTLARNSFEGAFIDDMTRSRFLAEIEALHV